MVHHITLVHAPASLLPTYMTAAGPVGFCALVLTNVAQASLTILPRNEAFLGLSMDTVSAAQGFAMVGLWFAIFLLGLYAWVVLSWIREWQKRGFGSSQHGVWPICRKTSCMGGWATMRRCGQLAQQQRS
jgi:hypothetical protein